MKTLTGQNITNNDLGLKSVKQLLFWIEKRKKAQQPAGFEPTVSLS